MGTGGYFQTKEQQKAREAAINEGIARQNAIIDEGRARVAAKITMAIIDRIVNEIIRPGPIAEERECYDMAGELRAITPELEALAKSIIDVNEGVK